MHRTIGMDFAVIMAVRNVGSALLLNGFMRTEPSARALTYLPESANLDDNTLSLPILYLTRRMIVNSSFIQQQDNEQYKTTCSM